MTDYVPDPEIAGLVRDLNRTARGDAPREEGPGGEELDPLLRWASERGASDLFLVAGSEPAARLDGELRVIDGPRLSVEAIESMVRSLLDAPGLERLRRDRSVDLAFERESVGRFRCNVHYQSGGPSLAIRVLPAEIPDLDALNLPAAVGKLANLRQGLVLITGTAGCGKSTTLAALLARIGATRACHIVTIEDPVEYRLPRGRALVEQVEVGRDSPSFAAALRASLRQAPDVLMVGEMRDLETVGIALTAAETGHLVLSTLHTASAARSVERIVDVFPGDRQEQIRMQLAGSLRAIVSQVLLPVAGDGGGRTPACEILLANESVRKRIRRSETHQLHQEITLGKMLGMVTLEESLAVRVRSGVVAYEAAAAWATHAAEFDKLVQGE